MIVWRGWGLGMALVAGAVFILFQMAVFAAMGDGYWENHRQLMNGIDAIVAGATVLLIRLTVLKPKRQTLTDPETGRTYNFSLQNDIFWIDVLWWGLLVIGLGVWQIFSREAWDSEFTASHQGSISERIAFWSICGAAVVLTVFALVFRGRDTPDQAYHSPLLLLGMVAGLPLAYVLGNVFILMFIEQGETFVVIAIGAALLFYSLGTLQAAAYKISWDEHAFRVRRLLGGMTEVQWSEVTSITLHTADSFDMKTTNARLRRHTISNHLVGSERFVDMLQRKRGGSAASAGAETVTI